MGQLRLGKGSAAKVHWESNVFFGEKVRSDFESTSSEVLWSMFVAHVAVILMYRKEKKNS